ncbi:MAG: metallophosphoesterase [Bacillota bacterium]
MSLFAISDLHLSLNGEKPMHIFGDRWEGHHLKLQEQWEEVVAGRDTVIIGGDISWALKLEEMEEDFRFIHALPGRKVFFKGNHDYWWQSYAKVKKALPRSICAVQNNYCLYENRVAICGTRGWNIPGIMNFAEQDERVYQRELIRLELSLGMAIKDGFDHIVAVLHYPPFGPGLEDSGFVTLLHQYNVKTCIYGHLHGDDHRRAFSGERDGITYYFTSSDYLEFRPLHIL